MKDATAGWVPCKICKLPNHVGMMQVLLKSGDTITCHVQDGVRWPEQLFKWAFIDFIEGRWALVNHEP